VIVHQVGFNFNLNYQLYFLESLNFAHTLYYGFSWVSDACFKSPVTGLVGLTFLRLD
jgi:hypothetical protein